MHFMLLALLVAVEILCDNKHLPQKNSTKVQNGSNDSMDVLKTKMETFKDDCSNSKQESLESDDRVSIKHPKQHDNRDSHTNMDHNLYRGYNFGQDYVNGRSGYGSANPYAAQTPYGVRYIRSKREQNRDYNDDQCLTQCMFGRLEVLDENRSPSEYALIKWFQDNAPQNEKRVKAIREVRRCFGQTVASDTGDGCDFSKLLSKCLNLEIGE